MGLADDVRSLELRREQGELTATQFEAALASLLRSATAALEITDVAHVGAPASPIIPSSGPPPSHIGAYELMELLGQGGMGSVYLAKHILKPGLFAVKVPRRDFLSRPGFGRRFKREAGVGLQLRHPGIVQVHDLVIDGEWAAIVMEFVAGPNVDTLLRNQGGPLAPHRVATIMIQVLEAMEYAHQAGVVHRDLKPKNLVMHPSGRVQVTDFGVAGLLGLEETQVGDLLGTTPYMAPEMYTDRGPIGHKADIYALGMTCYKLLVGHLPFPSHMNSYQVLRAKEEGRVPPPSDFVSSLPASLNSVLGRALSPRPEERYPSCKDFRIDLTQAAKELPPPPPRDPWDSGSIPPPPVTIHPAAPTQQEAEELAPISALWVVGMLCLLAIVLWTIADGSRPSGAEFSPPTAPAPAAANTQVPAAAPPPAEHAASQQTPASRPLAGSPAPLSKETASEAPPRARRSRSQRPAHSRNAPSPKRSRKAPKTSPPSSERAAASPPAPTVRSTPPPVLARQERTEQTLRRTKPVLRPSAPKPEVGLLYLSARPRSTVEINGKSYGNTDQTRQGLALPPGHYRVRFVCNAPAVCAELDIRSGVKTFEVEAGQEIRYTVDFFGLNESHGRRD